MIKDLYHFENGELLKYLYYSLFQAVFNFYHDGIKIVLVTFTKT